MFLLAIGSLIAGMSTTTTVAAAVAGSTVLGWVSSTPVAEPLPGSILFCDLVSKVAEHSGIYVGNGQIAHLDGGGEIELVSARGFLGRLGGFSTAISIYVSCRDGHPVGSLEIAERARSMVGKRRNYSLLMDNCHQFCSGCLTGEFDNPDNFLTFLKHSAKNVLGCNEWGDWQFDLKKEDNRFAAAPYVVSLEKNAVQLKKSLANLASARKTWTVDTPEMAQVHSEADDLELDLRTQLAKIDRYLILNRSGNLRVTKDSSSDSGL